jgi:ubiquinone/menaquinone biosynthesis C-methylase UbiE
MGIDVSGIKQGQKAMWSMGDYPDLAKRIEDVAERLVEAVGAREGMQLLDVATGSGNVAIAAARAGASVTGLDLTPELLDAARRRAGESGVEVRWVEGDAEELPFADDSFDLVTSCFGAMFAPRHERAAAELARVARPGGTIGVAAWTPEGLNGRLFKTVGAHMPAPPPELKSPTMWGEEAHMRSLFADSGAELSFERAMASFEAESTASWVDYNERVLGPAILARAALEPQGRYQQLRDDMIALYEDANESKDAFRADAEYLLTVARLPG